MALSDLWCSYWIFRPLFYDVEKKERLKILFYLADTKKTTEFRNRITWIFENLHIRRNSLDMEKQVFLNKLKLRASDKLNYKSFLQEVFVSCKILYQTLAILIKT